MTETTTPDLARAHEALREVMRLLDHPPGITFEAQSRANVAAWKVAREALAPLAVEPEECPLCRCGEDKSMHKGPLGSCTVCECIGFRLAPASPKGGE